MKNPQRILFAYKKSITFSGKYVTMVITELEILTIYDFCLIHWNYLEQGEA